MALAELPFFVFSAFKHLTYKKISSVTEYKISQWYMVIYYIYLYLFQYCQSQSYFGDMAKSICLRQHVWRFSPIEVVSTAIYKILSFTTASTIGCVKSKDIMQNI